MFQMQNEFQFQNEKKKYVTKFIYDRSNAFLPVLRHTSSQVICSMQTDFVWSQYRKVVPSQISWCLTEEEEVEAKKEEEEEKIQQNTRCGAHKSTTSSSHGIIFLLFSPFFDVCVCSYWNICIHFSDARASETIRIHWCFFLLMYALSSSLWEWILNIYYWMNVQWMFCWNSSRISIYSSSVITPTQNFRKILWNPIRSKISTNEKSLMQNIATISNPEHRLVESMASYFAFCKAKQLIYSLVSLFSQYMCSVLCIFFPLYASIPPNCWSFQKKKIKKKKIVFL